MDKDGNQLDEILYYANAGMMESYFKMNGISYLARSVHEDSSFTDSVFRMEVSFVGANPYVEIHTDEEAYQENFLLGYLPDDLQGVPVFTQLNYLGLYEGINLRATQADYAAYRFELSAGADPALILMDWLGIRDLIIMADGGLQVSNDAWNFGYQKPVAFQMIGDETLYVEAGYLVSGSKLRFQLGDYDPAYPLTIAMLPPVLNPAEPANPPCWSTRLQNMTINRKVRWKGNYQYVVGDMQAGALNTYPANNPGQWTAYTAGTSDAFVAKFDQNGVAQWYTYLGGSASDMGMNLAVNSTDDVYVIGVTTSNNFYTVKNNMPTNDYEATNNATVRKGFVVRLNSSGNYSNTNSFSTYFGCNGKNYMTAIAIDNSDNVYIGGGFESFSQNGASLQKSLTGAYNNVGFADGSFISKILPNNDIVWRSGIGNGTYNAASYHFSLMADIVTDATGNVYCMGTTTTSGVGTTLSGPITSFTTAGLFPRVSPSGVAFNYNKVTVGGTHTDYYLLKFNPANALVWSTFLGAGHEEMPIFNGAVATEISACGLALDNAGNLFCVGSSGNPTYYINSTYLPVINNIGAAAYYNPTFNGKGMDGMFAKFSPALQLQLCTYLGSNQDDYLHGISINGANCVLLCGTQIKGGNTSGSTAALPLGNVMGYSGTNCTNYYDNLFSGGVANTTYSGFFGQLGLNNCNLNYLGYFSRGNNVISSLSFRNTVSGSGVLAFSGRGDAGNGGSNGGVRLWQSGGYFYNIGNGGTVSNLYFSGTARLGGQYVEETPTESVRIYPNPNWGVLQVETDNPFYALQLTDLDGRQLWEKNFEGGQTKTEISLPDLAAGVYLLWLIQKDSVATHKLLIH